MFILTVYFTPINYKTLIVAHALVIFHTLYILKLLFEGLPGWVKVICVLKMMLFVQQNLCENVTSYSRLH